MSQRYLVNPPPSPHLEIVVYTYMPAERKKVKKKQIKINHTWEGISHEQLLKLIAELFVHAALSFQGPRPLDTTLSNQL
jgi:hypothetical protein